MYAIRSYYERGFRRIADAAVRAALVADGERKLERLEALEKEHGVRAVAFEMLGPPRS